MTSEELNKKYQGMLKNCPCCNGKAYLQKNEFCGGFRSQVYISIHCKNCGLQTQSFTPKIETSCIEDAIKAWNKRAGDCL